VGRGRDGDLLGWGGGGGRGGAMRRRMKEVGGRSEEATEMEGCICGNICTGGWICKANFLNGY
jgi:hypothetical protein